MKLNKIGNNYRVSASINDLLNTPAKIPYITHHIWLFDDRMVFPGSNHLDVTANSLQKITNSAPGKWSHYFWTNVPGLAKAALEASNQPYILSNVKIKDITEIFSEYDTKFKETFEKAKQLSIVSSSDLIRHLILFKYGGVYLDLDYQVHNYFIALHHLFKSYIPCCFNEDIFGNAIMASSKGHDFHFLSAEAFTDNLQLIDISNVTQDNFCSTVYKLGSSYRDGYRRYLEKYGEEIIQEDAHLPFESTYTTMTIEPCNVNIIADDSSLSLCTLGTDLQSNTWVSHNTNSNFPLVSLKELNIDLSTCNQCLEL